MVQVKHTFCRICESACGLTAEVDNGRVVSLAPNKEHIGTHGFACMKGLYQHKMYDSPDRLKHPLKRVGDGWQEITWNQALGEIGARIKALRGVSANAISMYVGTAAGFSILHPIFAEGFMQGIGSHNIFSSSTQDCANRFASATEMYGFPFAQPFVDLDNVNCLIVVGTNPVVSKWTFLQVAHPVKRLKEVTARGGKAIFVDPRFTESAKVGSAHVFIRPSTDVFFFLSFLHELILQGGVNESRCHRYMTGLPAIRELVKDWSPERTAEVTAVDPATLKALVRDYRLAEGAAIVTGTGVGMGRHGTLAHWLAEVINAVSGNLDRKGGTLLGRGIVDFPGFTKKRGLFDRTLRSRIGNFRQLNGGFPGGILADEILTPGKDQIKALFVTGGNPLLTMANGARLKEAMQQLELLVVTDIYLNETASLAHYVLPATSPLERPDLPFVFPLFLGMQSVPYLAATEVLQVPDGHQWDEATIYTELAKACGVNLFDSTVAQKLLQILMRLNRWFSRKANAGVPQELIMDLILRSSGNGSFKSLLAYGKGKPKPGAKPDDYLGVRVLTDDGLVQLAPSLFIEQAGLLGRELERELASIRSGRLRLISKRTHSTHNSWTQNIDELTNGRANQTNYLFMHPEDASARGLADESIADVMSSVSTIRLPVKCLPELMPGTVAVPHGWGHQHARGLSVASRLSGANVNLLVADGPDNVEALSGMAHLTGIEVQIAPAAGPLDSTSWSGISPEESTLIVRSA